MYQYKEDLNHSIQVIYSATCITSENKAKRREEKENKRRVERKEKYRIEEKRGRRRKEESERERESGKSFSFREGIHPINWRTQ